MQRAVFVNDFEKIRFISNPDEVAQVCGIVYNLQNENDEVLADVDAIVQRAYNHVTKWKWNDIAKKFENIILKLKKCTIFQLKPTLSCFVQKRRCTQQIRKTQ